MSGHIRNLEAQPIANNYHVLEQPLRQIEDGKIFDVYAVTKTIGEDGVAKTSASAYVSTNPDTRLQWLGEFSGEPTGEYSPAGRVKAVVDQAEVYSKTVRKDLPLWGLRMGIAQKRATRALKKLI